MQARTGQDYNLRLYGALLIVGAVVGMAGNALHPHTAEPDVAAAMRAVAQNDWWVAIHLAIVVSILLVVGGFVGVTQMLTGGPAGPLARLGLAAAMVGGAIVVISTSVDGFAVKALAREWTNAPSTEAEVALRVASGIKDADFAIWSIGMLTFFGLAFVGFGAALILSREFPVWFGWVAVLSGVGSSVAALIQTINTGEVQAAETIFLASSVLGTLWIFVLGIMLWRAASAPSGSSVPLRAR